MYQNPGLVKTYDAGAAIAPFTIVKLSADGTVINGAAATDALIGVNNEIDVASGERADVIHTGIAQVKLAGTVARGGFVTSDATGKGVAAAPAAGSNNGVVGRALRSGVSGDIIPVLLFIGQIQG
jgi:hypothetical protein